MSEASVEKEIVEKGLNAPRLTPAMIEAAIVAEGYYVFNGKHTACCLTLANGFTVLGESSVVSRENFDAELGRKIARDNAKSKIWPLEGYRLRQQLHDAEATNQNPAA